VLGRGGKTLVEQNDDEAELRRRGNDGVLVGRRLRWRKWKMASTMSFRRMRWC
jgi:hypothetical protein